MGSVAKQLSRCRRYGLADEHENMAPVHGRTRITRRVRRTMRLTTTTTMHDLVMGLCITRDAWGAAIAHGINTLDTPASMRRVCQRRRMHTS